MVAAEDVIEVEVVVEDEVEAAAGALFTHWEWATSGVLPVSS